ncbi:MAG: hypothetical protein QOC89_2894 [Paraburkholderia sp.]|uniref:hypothetical protein n=1 Tax=Paraburkholderia sp. TaxID=1926495 RepID=UPI002AFF153F|nr:hypothetical protein [Paraburkholderia sp.]MEA3085197.1 hypothetical protein [Paraburkholderia sp.]
MNATLQRQAVNHDCLEADYLIWEAVQARTPLAVYAEHNPELRRALEFFGGRT